MGFNPSRNRGRPTGDAALVLVFAAVALGAVAWGLLG